MATDSKVLASAIRNATQGPKAFAYGFATVAGEARSLASMAPSIIAGFPDNVSPETWAEVDAGFLLRYAEIQPITKYIRDGHDGWKVLEGTPPKGVEPHEIGVAFAMAYTGAEFGALRKEQPNLHAIVGDIRKKASTYRSNTRNRMIAMYKESQAGTRERAVNAVWYEAAQKVMDGLQTRAKNARAKGDTTAPAEDVVRKACDAFLKAIK